MKLLLRRLPWKISIFARFLKAQNAADRSHTVSSRLEDFSTQRTALMMKAALAAEMSDDAGVKEAEDLEAQLVHDNDC